MDPATLPSPEQRLALLQRVVERLTDAGYMYIGMDHFALPTDELARAQAQRTRRTRKTCPAMRRRSTQANWRSHAACASPPTTACAAT
jgi:coproporphyrinogen III oxidase-like Fe-S oxidoreductase